MNKQFDRAEGSSINIINTESTRHTDRDTTERMTERSNEGFVNNNLNINPNKIVNHEKD